MDYLNKGYKYIDMHVKVLINEDDYEIDEVEGGKLGTTVAGLEILRTSQWK